MTIRIDPDGQVNVMVGGEQPFSTIAPTPAQPVTTHALASQAPSSSRPPQRLRRAAPLRRHLLRRLRASDQAAPANQAALARPSEFSFQSLAERSLPTMSPRLLAWIDELGGLGSTTAPAASTARRLNDIGITNGSLTIDDRRNVIEWKLTQISST